jgi:hypothetical protein
MRQPAVRLRRAARVVIALAAPARVQLGSSFHFNVRIAPMNRHTNMKLHAAQGIARAGSRSPWAVWTPTLAALAAPRGGVVRSSGRSFAANGGIDVLK